MRIPKNDRQSETRVILKLHHSMAPIVAVLPLAKNKPEIVGMAKRSSALAACPARGIRTGGIGKLCAAG
jgi:glycyl-tRNA synthetase (class II)